MSLTYRYNSQQLGDLTKGFPDGGYPVFHRDIYNLSNLSLLQGTFAQWKEWNTVLSGCYVDEIDIDAQSVKVTSGYMMINEKVYFFEGYNGSYPFEVIPSGSTDDEREFKDAGIHTVGVNYDITVNEVFTFQPNEKYPDKVLNQGLYNGIYFDPFTCQRTEFITRRQGMVLGETRMFNKNGLQVLTTETGKNIVGSNTLRLDKYRGGTILPQFQWAWAGFDKATDYGNKFLRGSDTAYNMDEGGTNEHTLGTNNLPTHSHAAGELKTEPITPATKINVDETFATTPTDGAISVAGSGDTGTTIIEGDGTKPVLPLTTHNHIITGTTENGGLQGLKDSPDSLDNRPEFRDMIIIQAGNWNYNFNSRPINEANACWF
jgi:hypothetical protein